MTQGKTSLAGQGRLGRVGLAKPAYKAGLARPAWQRWICLVGLARRALPSPGLAGFPPNAGGYCLERRLMTGSFVFAILLGSGMDFFSLPREGLLLLAHLFIGNNILRRNGSRHGFGMGGVPESCPKVVFCMMHSSNDSCLDIGWGPCGELRKVYFA